MVIDPPSRHCSQLLANSLDALIHRMNLDDLRSVVELAKDRDLKHYNFLRSILLLASGSLTVLVALHPTSHEVGLPLLLLRATWITLGLGILFGTVSLHGEVWAAGHLTKRLAEQITAQPHAAASAIVAMLPRRYRWSAKACYASLIASVVSLVTYALLRG